MNNGSMTSSELGLRLVTQQETLPLAASLRYSEDDPYAVRFAFHVGLDEPVEWVFARDLLSAGIHDSRGIGDVRIWPSSDEVLNIELTSPFGQAHFEAPVAEISDFLRRTFEIVPAGQENGRVDVDAALSELLG
ncbi:MAG: SsgA family sporulation/cell division regulator [Streptosporangiales bacterium]|nr:SsgA family sporulation/cell division regulator [Streptosporangiales bacterium]